MQAVHELLTTDGLSADAARAAAASHPDSVRAHVQTVCLHRYTIHVQYALLTAYTRSADNAHMPCLLLAVILFAHRSADNVQMAEYASSCVLFVG